MRYKDKEIDINDEKEQRNNRNNRKNKKGKKKHRVLKVFLIILLLIVLFLGGFVGYSTYKNGWGWKGLLKTAVGTGSKTLEELEEFKILILGVSEDISVSLTDTIMVASYNPRTQKAVLLSIPRDTFVGKSKTYADSYDKINAIYQKEGAEGTLERVNEITGLDIEYYLVISNNALVELVDAIGGVEFNVPMDMDYDSKKQNLHIHLSKGLQTLNGEQAEGLVRFRKNNNGTTYSYEYGGNDYGRMKTQREFIKAVAKQTLQAKNITKIGNLIDIVQRNVTTNLPSWTAVKDYIPYAIDFNMDNLETETLPGTSQRIPANTGLWFFLHDEIDTENLIEELFKEPEVQETNNDGNTISQSSNITESGTSEVTNNSEIKVELLNGSGQSSLLTKATNALKADGYTVYKTGTTASTSKTKIINNANLPESVITDIKSILETGVAETENSSSSVDLTIVIGTDYEG